MSDERDDLERIIAERYHAARPEPTVLDSAIAGAILSAGYRKPRQVTTIEELDALPVGSVILSNKGEDSAQKDELGFWYLWGGDVGLVAEEIALPATVLHVGGAENE